MWPLNSETDPYRTEVVTTWWRRTSHWARKQIVSPVKTSSIGLNELITVTGFLFSFIVIIFGWISISEQTKIARAEQEMRDMQSRIADDQKVLATSVASLKDRQVRSKDIVLINPASDAYVVGDHVDLAWTYPGHNDRITYIVEVIGTKTGYLLKRTGKPVICGPQKANACHQVATDPAGQRTQVRNIEGAFLWRVVAVRKDSDPTSWSEEKNAVSEWSDYGAFTIYGDAAQRMTQEGVRVGALVSQANRFVKYGGGGKPGGFDVDLMTYLLQHCIKIVTGSRPAIDFDRTSCTTADRGSEARNDRRNLNISWVPITDIADGFARLRDRELDVFLGSLTKLKKREQGGVRFTSGYYSFSSNIYVELDAARPARTVRQWAEISARTLGVIRDSSNHQFASLLIADESLKNRLSLVTFGSWAELESALESGQVQGVLIDDVAALEKGKQWIKLEGLQDIDATSLYFKSDDYLGRRQEEFAFAVAPESPGGKFFDSLEESLRATAVLQIELQRNNGLQEQLRLSWLRRLFTGL